MSKRLANKTAIITGAAKGIGLSISERFAKEGANVVLADIDEKTLAKSLQNINLNSNNSELIVTDITSKKSIDNLIQNTLKRFDKINILVNNAGIAPNNLIENQSLEEWEKVIKTNLTGFFLCSKAVVESMNNIGGGHIVNISSISGQRGSVGRSAYGVSKAGIIQLTREMAVEFANMNILVNSIAPGPIITDITNNSDVATNSYLDRIPLRRFGNKESVASAAVYLCSDECDFTTGHTLNVDGGFNDAGLLFPKDKL